MTYNLRFLLVASSLFHKSLSAAITQNLGVHVAAITPTHFGQIGINPVTDLGPEDQYAAPTGLLTKVLVVENGQTQWVGPDSFAEVTVTKTFGNSVETIATEVHVSASKATSSADGMDVGDVIITVTPELKGMLESFAADAVEACKLAVKSKMIRRQNPNLNAPTEAFTQCMYRQAVQATAEGGRLDTLVDLEANGVMGEIPAGAGAELELAAAAAQIATNQLRKNGAYYAAVIGLLYLVESKVAHAVKIPSNPVGVKKPQEPSSTKGCKSGAPTAEAAPVCRDDDCKGLAREKKCTTGEWKDCDCLETIAYRQEIQYVIPAWLILQNQLISEIESTPDMGTVECHEDGGHKGWNGTIYSDPEEWCLCSEIFKPASLYSILPSPTEKCAYTTLPPSPITTDPNRPKPTDDPITSCSSFVRTIEDMSTSSVSSAVTMCTCNNNVEYDYYTPSVMTETPNACDWIIPEPTRSPLPRPPQDGDGNFLVNGGKVKCIGHHQGSPDWYMPNYSARNLTATEVCAPWDEMIYPIGPGQAYPNYARRPHLYHEDENRGMVWFDVKYIEGGQNCPVLDIGKKDKAELCREIFNDIYNTCGGVDEDLQGGRFERDCYRWQVAKGCNVIQDGDCLFKK